MQSHRRHFLAMATAVAALPYLPRPARAENYPARPVTIVVGQAAGGGADVVARMIGQWLSERLGQPFVVENRTGAGGNIAAEAVARAPADGYTLLLITPANVIATSLYKNPNYEFGRDIAPVASISREHLFMVVNPSFPARTVPEFIAYARSHPGGINMGSAGNGSPQHVAGELFKMMTGVAMTHVPYRGQAPALADLLGGQMQVVFAATPSVTEFIKTGKLRALAVTTAARSASLPDIPSVGDFVAGYEASGFLGLGAGRNVPGPIVEGLNREIAGALADPKIKAQLDNLGSTVMSGSAAEFGAFMAGQTEKWTNVVTVAGIKAD